MFCMFQSGENTGLLQQQEVSFVIPNILYALLFTVLRTYSFILSLGEFATEFVIFFEYFSACNSFKFD